MDKTWVYSTISFCVALIAVAYFVNQCTIQRNAERYKTLQTCIEKTGKPLECRHSILQRGVE